MELVPLPVTLATQKVDTGRMAVEGQPKQKVTRLLCNKQARNERVYL
jgi:hypothetical protein